MIGPKREDVGPFRRLAGTMLVAALVGCGLSLTIATLAVRLDQAGFNARAIGLNTAAEGVAVLIGAPFVPRVARRLGVARLLTLALVTGAAVLVGFTLTSDYVAWLILRFGVGLSATVIFVLSEFWITSTAPARRTGFPIAIYVTSLAIGSSLGPMILATAGSTGALPFTVAGALFLVASIPSALNGGAAPTVNPSHDEAVFAVLRRAPAVSSAGLLHGAIEASAFSLLPVYALHAGAPVAAGASLVSVFVLGAMVLQLPIGWIADRVDRRRLLLVLAVAGAVGAGLLALLPPRDMLAFRLVLLAWGGVVGAFYPVGLNQLGTELRRSGDGLVGGNAAFVMSYALGMMAGPPLIGAGLDLAPPSGLFWTMAALIGLYGCAVRVRFNHRRPRSPRPAILD